MTFPRMGHKYIGCSRGVIDRGSRSGSGHRRSFSADRQLRQASCWLGSISGQATLSEALVEHVACTWAGPASTICSLSRRCRLWRSRHGRRCLQSVRIVPVYLLHTCTTSETVRCCHCLLHFSTAQRHPFVHLHDPRPGGVREAIKFAGPLAQGVLRPFSFVLFYY